MYDWLYIKMNVASLEWPISSILHVNIGHPILKEDGDASDTVVLSRD